MCEYTAKIHEAQQMLLSRAGVAPTVGLVLGSGWGELIGGVQDAVRVPYGQVPGMRASTVPGHAGEWVLGKLGGQSVVIMSGRLHYYEGYGLRDVTFPIRVMKAMGVQVLILTNAAGAVNMSYQAGDLMLVTDHLNLCAVNPLFGPNDDNLGPRFPDMTRAYDRDLIALAKAAAQRAGVTAREGVYAWMTGPSFETPAEIRMLRALGADAVGMSTVPEAIVAAHAGMRVMAASCMTNMAAGVLPQPLTHGEVLETMERVKKPFGRLIADVVAHCQDA